jgi:glycosyltransferase involved in cell wall biosynthesis
VALNEDNKTWLDCVIEMNSFISEIGRIIPIVRNNFIHKTTNNKLILYNNFDLVHAHTLFSNGSYAYYLYRKYEINYIVTITNSDINYALKYLFHLEEYILAILKEARAIIFTNPVYKLQLQKRIENRKGFIEIIDKKSFIIPFRISDFWFDNLFMAKKRPENSEFNLLYVGEISRNKNLIYLINIIKAIPNYKFKLKIVGGTLNKSANKKYLRYILKMISSLPNIRYIGEVLDNKKLLELYRESHIFCLTSKLESFGLVYIEALSQGSPILYSKNQGVDGLFEEGEVGYPADVNSIMNGAEKLMSIIDNYGTLSRNAILKSREFSRKEIAIKYKKMLTSIGYLD